ncbi:MerR family transcriptional regulator [Gordonia insulae]|uniref:HTH merR-type domain-containing protein n=1 Tax=Gordonia insulae TaxID=2420509 RepID=A0A3G8JM39_9ACTN|nr:hypothetical protein [Gordonia insulae]AZG45652.1 hypothetical protein D7316_02252 [Gordonia insulae]
MIQPGDDFVTLERACSLTERNRRTIARWVREGKVSTRIDDDGHKRYRHADLLNAKQQSERARRKGLKNVPEETTEKVDPRRQLADLVRETPEIILTLRLAAVSEKNRNKVPSGTDTRGHSLVPMNLTMIEQADKEFGYLVGWGIRTGMDADGSAYRVNGEIRGTDTKGSVDVLRRSVIHVLASHYDDEQVQARLNQLTEIRLQSLRLLASMT